MLYMQCARSVQSMDKKEKVPAVLKLKFQTATGRQ